MVTNDSSIWEKARSLKDHDKPPRTFYNRTQSKTFQWLNGSFGTNCRLTEMQSAIGRLLLKNCRSGWKPDETTRQNYWKLVDLFPACGHLYLTRTYYHSYYKFYTYLKPEELAPGWDRLQVIDAIRAHGVPCFSGSWSEIYREQAFPRHWKPASPLPAATEIQITYQKSSTKTRIFSPISIGLQCEIYLHC